MKVSLSHFHTIRPAFETAQGEVLKWLAEAHTKAEGSLQNWSHQEEQEFKREIQEKLFSLGIGEDKVSKRGVQFSDFFHSDWEEMQIYNLHKKKEGFGQKERTLFFDHTVADLFEQFYSETSTLPNHLIHVTCTGYTAPSGAQKIVAKRGFEKKTVVTHAYHMGCYASFPAIRMALGFFHTPAKNLKSIDIVHTEICSLHLNPLLHETEQLVVQSLFGDGSIKYSLVSDEPKDALNILSLHEEIIPNSSHCMSWKTEDWGLRMTLSKEIPVLIARHLKSFLSHLLEKNDQNLEEVMPHALFAIHPGGPKIIQQIGKVLDLRPEQIEHSSHILRQFGNMSSATLPHIWQEMIRDSKVASKTPVISLAFGPGLSISGALFEMGDKSWAS